MKYYSFIWLLFLTMLNHSVVNADVFIVLAPSQIEIDTENAKTKPIVTDFRVGYKLDAHQLELAVMTSLSDDQLNELTTDVSSITSLFYRYLPYQRDQLKLHLVMGVSQIDIDSSYPIEPDTTDDFVGFSYGVGLQEKFISLPALSLKFEWLQLYRGDKLNINALSLGLRYDF